QIKIRGMRVELGEIEHALATHPAIRTATLTATDSINAYLVPADPDRPPPVQAVRDHLRARLPEHMIPTTFTFLPELPLTATGKIRRNALPVPQRQEESPFEAPATPAEHAVTEIWQSVLGAEAIGIHDNFFALGGDSIRSLNVVARLRGRGYAVTLEQIFQHQTVRELAGVLTPLETPAADTAENAPERQAFGLLDPADLARLTKRYGGPSR
ncbi:phosphopantetheine-binding protein, partial [Rhizohabitans arisaemae]|uniref:phosphopantetheine-binding protein n=1 Tax=Rhizohabitans arisaemae TaxID=2720610 RepID=UPI0024B1E255